MDLDAWRSLRDIDEAHGWPKGRAFRAFKALAPRLVEGRDYRVLDAEHDPAAVQALRAAGRVYASSVKLILLAPAVAGQLADS